MEIPKTCPLDNICELLKKQADSFESVSRQPWVVAGPIYPLTPDQMEIINKRLLEAYGCADSNRELCPVVYWGPRILRVLYKPREVNPN